MKKAYQEKNKYIIHEFTYLNCYEFIHERVRNIFNKISKVSVIKFQF